MPTVPTSGFVCSPQGGNLGWWHLPDSSCTFLIQINPSLKMLLFSSATPRDLSSLLPAVGLHRVSITPSGVSRSPSLCDGEGTAKLRLEPNVDFLHFGCRKCPVSRGIRVPALGRLRGQPCAEGVPAACPRVGLCWCSGCTGGHGGSEEPRVLSAVLRPTV